MYIYKVFEDDFSYREYAGDKDVKYYLSEVLAEEDLRNRLEERPTSSARIECISTED